MLQHNYNGHPQEDDKKDYKSSCLESLAKNKNKTKLCSGPASKWEMHIFNV